MTDMTYDAEADAVYITVGAGKVERTRKSGQFIYGLDADGRIAGIEILSASKILAPGDWQKARPPRENTHRHGQAVDLHRGFLFIKRASPRAAGPRKES